VRLGAQNCRTKARQFAASLVSINGSGGGREVGGRVERPLWVKADLSLRNWHVRFPLTTNILSLDIDVC
jgi:hypothetical protein